MEKRIIALLLAFVMLISTFGSLSVIAFADDIDEEETTETQEPAATPDSSLSGNITMYLCSYWENGSLVPHVFIYVENGTNHEITVGHYICPSGQGVSVGTLGFSVIDGDGPGVYYNIECYRERGKDTPKNFMCISKVISESQLSGMSSYIKNANWWDPIAVNCCFFAAMCWNTAGGSFVFPLVCLPWIMRIEIALKGASHSINLYKAESNQVYKQTLTGIKAASSGSYN